MFWNNKNKEKILELERQVLRQKLIISEMNGVYNNLLNYSKTLEVVVTDSSFTPMFTSDEIKSLITLCHPDKHNGKLIATQLTQRLLELRDKNK